MADIIESLTPSLLASMLKGRQRMNILLKEKGSLLTAVAREDSISIIWKDKDLLTVEKASKTELLERARGTLSLRQGNCYFMVK
jgi:hypothetical protein